MLNLHVSVSVGGINLSWVPRRDPVPKFILFFPVLLIQAFHP